MNTADLITAFFNNEMSPDQERQFLLSVASSDSLRLGLKSHAMLDKILYEESSQSRVPVEVRMNIMKQAAVVAAAGGSALAPGEALASDREETPDLILSKNSAASRPTDTSRRFLRWSSAALLLMIGIGSFFAGFYTGTETADEEGAPTAQENREIIAPTLPQTNMQVPVSSAIEEKTGGNSIDMAGRIGESETGKTTSASNANGSTSRERTSAAIASGNRTRSGATNSASEPDPEPMNGNVIKSNPLEQFTVPSDSTRSNR